MVSSGVIESFIVIVNPVIFGYEKFCILILGNIDKTIKEQDIFKKVTLLGNVLEGAAIFVLYDRDMTEEKIGILTDLLKPATLETVFASLRPVTMKIQSSDLVIMKHLLTDPRMAVEDIAKETSLSSKTVGRRLEKMRENHILQFTNY